MNKIAQATATALDEISFHAKKLADSCRDESIKPLEVMASCRLMIKWLTCLCIQCSPSRSADYGERIDKLTEQAYKEFDEATGYTERKGSIQ